MAVDPSVEYQVVAAELTAAGPAVAGKMFGMPCLKVDGEAFAGLHQARWADLGRHALAYVSRAAGGGDARGR